MGKFILFLIFVFGLAAAPRIDSTRKLERQIKTIRADDVNWRKIAWKSCLLEGLSEARKTGKPLILWCYIDRPIDDTRC